MDREKVAPVDNVLRDAVRNAAAERAVLSEVLLRVGVMHNAENLKTIFRRTHIDARFAQAFQLKWVINDCRHLLSPDAQKQTLGCGEARLRSSGATLHASARLRFQSWARTTLATESA